MDHYFSFLMQHWELTLATVIVLLLIFVYETREQVKGLVQISPQRAVELINRHHAIVVDVRNEALFNTGHIAHAINVPAHEMFQRENQLEKFKKQPIILVCAMGNQSMKSLRILKKHGFNEIYSLKGGMGAWKLAGYPSRLG